MGTKPVKELRSLYDNVGPFCEGLAWAHKGGKWFHIRPDGTPAYTQVFDQVYSFENGVAWAFDRGRHIRINPQGEEVNTRGERVK